MFYHKEKISYLEALKLQYQLSDQVRETKEDQFFVTSHESCLTLAENKSWLKKEQPYPTYLIKRGGTWTFHHLDQWICYVHFYLEKEKTLKNIVHFLLKTLQDSLETYFKEPFHEQEGLWFQNKKILSFGLGLEKRVTLHGLALNFSIDKELIQTIDPCGLNYQQYAGLKDFFSFDENHLKDFLKKQLLLSYERRFK